jgi:DUF4097 and DUF4098 domain-containing protein YvlB
MRSATNLGWIPCLLAAALLIPGVQAEGAETIKRSFKVGDGGELDLETDVGSIEVQASGSGEVTVEVRRSGSRADELDVDFSQSGDDVTVRAELPRKMGWFGGRSPRVRFIVTVPESYNLDLNTAGGSISVSDLEGEARVKTSGGSLSFGNITGSVWGRTSGGSISLDGCSGDADINTSGGSIHIGDVDGEVKAHTSGGSIEIGRARASVDADTSGGSIRVKEVMGPISASTSGGSVSAYISEQPSSDCRLTTSGGGITVYLADDVAVDISAHASSKVNCDLDLSDSHRSKRSISGKLNGGGPELYLRTSGGSVSILSR